MYSGLFEVCSLQCNVEGDNMTFFIGNYNSNIEKKSYINEDDKIYKYVQLLCIILLLHSLRQKYQLWSIVNPLAVH